MRVRGKLISWLAGKDWDVVLYPAGFIANQRKQMDDAMASFVTRVVKNVAEDMDRPVIH